MPTLSADAPTPVLPSLSPHFPDAHVTVPCSLDTMRLLLRRACPGLGVGDRLSRHDLVEVRYHSRRSFVRVWNRASDGLKVEMSPQAICLEFSVPRLLRGGNHLLAGITEAEVGELVASLPERIFPGLAARTGTPWVVARIDPCVDFCGPVKELAMSMRYARYPRVKQRGRRVGKGWQIPVDSLIDGAAIRWMRGSSKGVRLQMYDKGAQMVMVHQKSAEPGRYGRWELLVRQPGKRKWVVDALVGNGEWDGNRPVLLLDAGPNHPPVTAPLDFARMRALVVGEVRSVEDGAGVPMPAFRTKTRARLLAMARSPMVTSTQRSKYRERRLEQRRQAYVLAVREGLAPRPSRFLSLVGDVCGRIVP